MSAKMNFSRRQFLSSTVTGVVACATAPMLIPQSAFGANERIQVGQIGCGRIALSMDIPGVAKHPDLARIVAVCDVDSKRLDLGRKDVERRYSARNVSQQVKKFDNYRALLRDGNVDAVAISTPDHWHAEAIVAAALAGKDIYVQKPLTMTVEEGRLVSNTVSQKNRIFQIGSQQRSTVQFRKACEFVRSGRIGTLKTVRIGLPTDPAGGNAAEMPVPPNLNYDMWLGSTPRVPYTEERVHPQNSVEARPGWLRIESYCLGMITGWGSHHVDIAHWGMDTEHTGPIEAEAKAEFPKGGLWNVHGPYHIEMKYANGVTMVIDNNFTNGVRFEGDKGWIFVSRGEAKATASDPASAFGKALDASDKAILSAPLKADEVHLYVSEDHHLNWLQSMRSRKPAVTTVEIAHRSTTACIIGWIAMKLGRKLRWDPKKEVFIDDAEANALCSRAQRGPYGTRNIKRI